MSIAAAPSPSAEQRFVFYNLTWRQYEELLRTLGERRLRHTYVRGTLEIMSPSRHHEWVKSLLAEFVKVICRVTRQPRLSIGSTSFKYEAWDHGFEADEGFYLGADSVARGRDWEVFDPERDPPPDLFVEVDVSSSSDDRIEIYRRMKVGEVWRYRKEAVSFHVLNDLGDYEQSATSRIFPFLAAADIGLLLNRRSVLDDTQLEADFEAWVRGQVEPAAD